jgi:NADH dehydrogenase
MKSLDDAVRLRHRLIENLEDADFECSAHRRRPLLTCVVAGGGFAGVETAAAVHDFLHEAVRFYPHVDPAQLRLVLVHSGPVLLPELGEKLGRYAQEKLAGRGIEVRVGTRVSALAADRVALADGTTIETHTLVWTAGTSPHPLLATLPCRTERGRVVVDEFLAVPDHAGVWALGDCAQVPDLRAGGTCPPTAQHAVRQGKVLARNLVAAIDGRPRRAFSFATLGQLAAIGRRTGVARVFGVQFSGFAAWWLWRTVYLGKLPRFEKKLRVALDWTLDVLFSKDLVHLSSRPPHAVHAVPAAGDAAGLEVESCDLPARR